MIANPTDTTPIDQIPVGVVTNPVLDEIYRAHDSMTPNAQAAVARAHEIASGPAAAGPDPLRVPTSPAAPVEPKTAMTASVIPPVSGESAEAPGGAGDSAAPHAMEPVAVANPDGPVQSSLQKAGIGNTIPQVAPKMTASQRLSDMQTKGSGISQVKSPWLRVPLQILDAVASSVAPSLTMGIPGTGMHHLAVERGLERQVGDEQSQQKAKTEASTAESENTLRTAQASNSNAEADEHTQQAAALKNNPKPTNEWIQLTEPVVDPLHPEIGPQIAFANKNDPKQGLVYGNAPVAAKPTADKVPTYHVQPDGSIVALHYEPKDGSTKSEVVYKGDPKVETDLADLEIDGKPHKVIVNKQTGVQIKDLGPSGIKPPVTNVNQGTWTIQEDADGNPIEYNSKSGETRAVAAGGVQKAGTHAKADAAKQPAKDALNYANSYLQNGAHTGAGDEALQEKFFELAKPTTGFRMTQPQMDMLQHSRSWMESLAAHLRHATVGTWFDDEQRKQIVQTMRDLAKAKGIEIETPESDTTKPKPAAATPPPAAATEKTYSQADVDRAVAEKNGTADQIEAAFKAKGYVKK